MQELILATAISILPLFFLTYTNNPITPNKIALLTISLVIISGIQLAKIIKNKKITPPSLSLTSLIILLMVIYISNIFTSPTNKMLAIVNRIIPMATIFTITIITTTLEKQKLIKRLKQLLPISGILLAIYTLIPIILSTQQNMSNKITNIFINPTGSITSLITILTITTISTLYIAINSKSQLKKTTLFIVASIQLSAMAANIALIINKNITIPTIPQRAGWFMLLDAFKYPKNVFLGIGMLNFANFFNIDKPLFLNKTIFTNITSASSSNEIFQIATTLGLIWLIILLFMIIKGIKNTNSRYIKLILGTIFIAMFITPFDITLYTYCLYLLESPIQTITKMQFLYQTIYYYTVL